MGKIGDPVTSSFISCYTAISSFDNSGTYPWVVVRGTKSESGVMRSSNVGVNSSETTMSFNYTASEMMKLLLLILNILNILIILVCS